MIPSWAILFVRGVNHRMSNAEEHQSTFFEAHLICPVCKMMFGHLFFPDEVPVSGHRPEKAEALL